MQVKHNTKHRWYLIDATVPEPEGAVSAWAVWGQQADFRESLPVTLKGRILQVVRASGGSGAAPRLELADSRGEVLPERLSIRPLSPLRAVWMISRRVVVSCLKLSRKRRLELGLSVWSVFLRPWHAYRQLGRLRAFYPPLSYSQWIFECEALLRASVARNQKKVRRKLGEVVLRPLIDLRSGWSAEQLVKVYDSAKQQTGPGFPVTVLLPQNFSDSAELRNLVPDAEQVAEHDLGSWLNSCPAGWVLWLTPNSLLADWAMAWLIPALAKRPGVEMMYSDHDELTTRGDRKRPMFKPDWSLEFARASGYTGEVLVLKGSRLLERLKAGRRLPSAYGLALDFGARARDRVAHLPVILWHRVGQTPFVNRNELTQHLKSLGAHAQVCEDSRGFPRVRYSFSGDVPRVSIVIPTRNMLHFLQPCVDSLLSKTEWPDLEVLIVDNQSDCPETLRYMCEVDADCRVTVLRYDHPFNFSAINNYAVEHATGEVLCLLNNDTEVIRPDWLQEMVSRLMQPGVGVVGARLYFSDGRLQHAGDVLGPGGCATHLHGAIAGDDPGYMNRAVLPQDVSAVTAACLVTRKSLYQSLGGLDEANLPVAFNDVDYCLRARESGWSVVYTPYAELYHHESVSRGKDDNPQKAARAAREVRYVQQRWLHVIENDPFYNPNLNFAQPDCQFGRFPRVYYPW